MKTLYFFRVKAEDKSGTYYTGSYLAPKRIRTSEQYVDARGNIFNMIMEKSKKDGLDLDRENLAINSFNML